MSSQRPYLLRALYEWIADNGMTPHLVVDARSPGVRVPPSAVRDGQVVLNIADRAVARLQMDNDAVTFSARFGGVSQAVHVPLAAVLAIYARETGMGMGMPPEDRTGDTAPQGPDSGPAPVAATPALQGVERGAPDDAPPTDTPPPRRGGHLKVVK